eukprot:9503813-Pyramimonas_sp.AAC.1
MVAELEPLSTKVRKLFQKLSRPDEVELPDTQENIMKSITSHNTNMVSIVNRVKGMRLASRGSLCADVDGAKAKHEEVLKTIAHVIPALEYYFKSSKKDGKSATNHTAYMKRKAAPSLEPSGPIVF